MIDSNYGSNTIFFNINEVAKIIEVSTSTIRNWEKKDLFTAKRSANSYRIYSLNDIEILKRIKHYSKNYQMNSQAIKDILMPHIQAPPIIKNNLKKPPSHTPSRKLLGSKWKDHRIKLNKTLEEVALDIDISISYLSKIENCQANVSYEVIQKLASYYGENVLHFFEPEEEQNIIVEKGKGEKLQTGLPGVLMESLIAQKDKVLFPMMYYVEPGYGSIMTQKHNGEEFIHVLKGVLEITLDEKDLYTLKEGDSIYFKSSTSHSWKNKDKSTAKLLWVHSPLERNI